MRRPRLLQDVVTHPDASPTKYRQNRSPTSKLVSACSRRAGARRMACGGFMSTQTPCHAQGRRRQPAEVVADRGLTNHSPAFPPGYGSNDINPTSMSRFTSMFREAQGLHGGGGPITHRLGFRPKVAHLHTREDEVTEPTHTSWIHATIPGHSANIVHIGLWGADCTPS